MRSINVGLDYGTSASKMVFWDELSPGRPRAYIAQAGNEEPRIPSSVAFDGETLTFGLDRKDIADGKVIWYESVKMRMAAEVSASHRAFCYGGTPVPPQGLSFQDLAALTVWYLRSTAERIVSEKLHLPLSAFSISVVLGVPRQFYEQPAIRDAFLKVATLAHILHKQSSLSGHKLTVSEAKRALAAAGPVDVRQYDYRAWLRSEAEAAMYWPIKSPEVAAGGYAEVDVGAGTTNATIVGIWATNHSGRWSKHNLGFHGAFSCPTGMDAVDAAIARYTGVPSNNDCLALRGQERDLLQSIPFTHMRGVYESIREAYELAWRSATRRLSDAERKSYPDHDLFLAGGGSLIPDLGHFLSEDPARPRWKRKIRMLEPPPDLFYLDDKPVEQRNMIFVSPAYGLSFRQDEVPDEYTCEEEPLRMPKAKGMSVIYEK